ncbi:hypothetical protein [Pediococcus argentinicus]|uniref:hypothetical protein n=1 Tax=Pediococcus argentinicus TaxID=480391 RepID=UPI00070C7545|nr:hypothetical protein [Pediococcus argentinicus]NKZ21756.1 ribonuclease G [Pediococcus argentinicus]GEP18986.1 hypothetical protein LSA03_03700 [Pediococcus argentinicus]
MNNQIKPIPEEIQKWSWGAFMFNIWWGIGNKTYLPLLCLIPIFNIIWVFIVGAYGNSWAWQNGNFDTVADFKLANKVWERAGIIKFIFYVAVSCLLLTIFIIFSIIMIIAD